MIIVLLTAKAMQKFGIWLVYARTRILYTDGTISAMLLKSYETDKFLKEKSYLLQHPAPCAPLTHGPVVNTSNALSRTTENFESASL